MAHKISPMPPVWQEHSGVAGEELSIHTAISITNRMRITVLDHKYGDSIVGSLTYSEAQELMWALKDSLRMMRDAS